MANIYAGLTSYQKNAIKNRLKVEWTYTFNTMDSNMAFFTLEYQNSQLLLAEIKK